MAITVFKESSYSVSGLLSRIEHGEIALPDIQRPFVWNNAKVRDLFDSMYKGFPVGYLLLCATGAEASARQIGVEDKQSVASLLIIDGQQRLTSLYAVIYGARIIKKDFSEGRISIAFRPHDEKFEVTDVAIRNDPEFITDISEVFQGGFHSYTNKFLTKVENYRGVELSDSEKNRLVENIDRLKDLQNYPFQAIELDRSVDEELVAEVFVRINSKGVQLSSADFILTLMSVFWDRGRRELEQFSRLAKASNPKSPSPYNYFIEPSPDQLLRASVGLAFRRGKLQSIYSILRGKDLETGEFSAERREVQFERLRIAHEATLNLTNWHEYLKCLRHAGFRSSRMISSETAVMYVYIIWLVGRIEFKVDLQKLKEVTARWWFMAHTTSRYSNSPETQIEYDLNRIRSVSVENSDGFCQLLDHIVEDVFTRDYWEITLPNRLDTSSSKSPPLSAYWAALNILDADVLFSKQKVSEMLDPAITPIRDMERHHLFPRAYLSKIGVQKSLINSIANMAFVDWTENVKISNSEPTHYWPIFSEQLDSEQIERQMHWHALPRGWEQLDYDSFREKRRKLIAKITKEGFEKLRAATPTESDKKPHVRKLLSAGESNVLEFKERARWSFGTEMKDKSEQIIVKCIAGFLNSEGGTLLIGVSDDGIPVGVEADYKTLSKGNRDGFELFLTQLIKNKLAQV